ncbi:MAG TPA: SulP family inorganic anion transporter [Solirubrobacteraceae bacterium]|nr:SulP family inorganic anion transporter [Solirubrobacteraceae bacterium]
MKRLLPRRTDYRIGEWRHDLIAGVTVAVVALPLALGFGIASGLGAEAGIVTAIVAGIAAAVFGGSDVQVSGPTGAMTVVLVPVVADVGPSGVVVVALAAGLLLAVAGYARLGRYAGILPWPVIVGFTAGIGLLILFQQLPSAFGVPAVDGDGPTLGAMRALTEPGQWQSGALALFGLVVGLMLVLPRLHRALPASLLAVTVATGVAAAFDVSAATIGHIPSGLPAPSLPGVTIADLPQLSGAILAVAALAGIESLLSAKVADGMTDGKPLDPNRELFGQGIANVAVSFFGGMPATGAIARTAVNVRSGARTRAAAIAHSVVLVVVVVSLAPLLGRIPLAALAGVLAVTAVRMTEPAAVIRIARARGSDALLVVVTAGSTLAFDLVIAVGVGIALAGLLALRAIATNTTFDSEPIEAIDGIELTAELEHALLQRHIVAYRLDGALFFGAAERFLVELTQISDVDVVILRLERLRMLDSTGAQALAELIGHLEDRGITVLLTSVRPEHQRLLERIGALDTLAHRNHLLPGIGEALDHAWSHRMRAVSSELQPG